MKYSFLILIFSGTVFLCAILVHAQLNSLDEIQQIIRTGQLEIAADQLTSFIRQYPDSIKAYAILGKVYMAIGGPNNRTLAEQILWSGLRNDPKNAELFRLLSELKKQQEMPELSETWLEKASKTNRSDQKMLSELLDMYIKKHDVKQIESLTKFVEDAVIKYPKSPLSYLMMAKLETGLKHPDKAIPFLEKGLKLDVKNPAIHKALSEACLLSGMGDRFTNEYYTWLATETNPQLLQREYELAEMVMENENAAAFRKLIFPEKRTYLLQYWKDHDPYPVSVLNERLMEHMRRVMYSMEAFHTIQGYLGFDDRGKTYIRWGEPEQRYTEANAESWYYPSYGLYAAFDFLDDNGFYREIFSPEDAIDHVAKLKLETRVAALGNFYDRRSIQLGGIYQIMAAEASVLNANDLEGMRQFESHVTEFITDKVSVKRDKKPRYELKLDMPKLNFIYRAIQFRGDTGTTRVELAYGVPLEQLKPTSKKDSTITLTFQSDLVVLDSLKNRSFNTESRRQFACAPEINYKTENFVGEDKNSLPPGNYIMTFQIVEYSKKLGDFKVERLKVRDFTGDTLMMSDLKFSQKIEALGMDLSKKMEKLSVMPYPFSKISRRNSIFLYFELYNLLLQPDKGSKYQVSLKVAKERTKGEYFLLPIQTIGRIFSGGKPQTIETVYNRQGDSQTALEWIELDLKGVESGHSRLTVIVEDLVANKKTENEIEFDLED